MRRIILVAALLAFGGTAGAQWWNPFETECEKAARIKATHLIKVEEPKVRGILKRDCAKPDFKPTVRGLEYSSCAELFAAYGGVEAAIKAAKEEGYEKAYRRALSACMRASK